MKKKKDSQSHSKVSMWCVGLILNDGRHKACIFDYYEEAVLFLYTALDGVLENLNVKDANMWEL